ncbi:MAG: putative permease [Myxococcales bacterium]|nr:putative permease [Myxococcales bacterium]
MDVASLLRRKPTESVGAAGEGEGGLRRSLGAFDLTMLGVGAIVGAGIFSSVGEMAAGSATHPGAGPALILSYLLTAFACGLCALCYAEIASMVPVAGSAYTYSYVALGEIFAWIIGWDLIIEYAVGNIYVAQSWSDYFRSFLTGAFGLDFPAWMATDLQTVAREPALRALAPVLHTPFGALVVGFNLPAAFVVAALTLLLVRGVRESARANAVMVTFKLVLVVAFVGLGAAYVEPAHWHPFAPHGFRGVWAGASLAFFSYIGFDAVSTLGEETKTPQRDLPRGMLWSLAICTVLYVAVAAVMTGLVPAAELGTGDPLAHALRAAGLARAATAMSFGAVIAVTAVLLVFQLGQPRILFAMARDGLLPPAFARVHGRFRTPVFGTVLTGVFVAVMPTFLTQDQALELTNIGTLFAFLLVALGVIALRVREPGRARPFRCPGYPVTPALAAASCLALMAGLPSTNWWRFAIWLAVGLVIYFSYGAKRSVLARRSSARTKSPR